MSRAALILSLQVPASAPLWDTAFAARLLELAEQAGADLLVLGETGPASAAPAYDAALVAAWMAPRSRSVGLVASVSALHSEPFHVARALSAVDFLSGGRCGWWPSGGGVDWPRYGAVGQVPDAQQAAKTIDFIAATQSLWDSWDADALIIDQASGSYLHSDRVRRSNYRGPFHQVQGPLNAARPPQGYPVLLQSDRDAHAAAVAADLRIVDVDAATARDGERRLARIGCKEIAGPKLDAALKQHAAGTLHGLHLLLADPLAELAEFAAAIAPQWRQRGLLAASNREGMLRTRLGLPIPLTAPQAARAAGSRK